MSWRGGVGGSGAARPTAGRREFRERLHGCLGVQGDALSGLARCPAHVLVRLPADSVSGQDAPS
jgi:hypothetical protein